MDNSLCILKPGMWEPLEVNLLESLPSDSSSQNPEPSVVRYREFYSGGPGGLITP